MRIIKTENYIKVKEAYGNTMYHVTLEQNVPRILTEGLKINQELGFTQSPEGWIDEYYGGIRPIFLSVKPWEGGKGLKAIQVDVSGLNLVADIPSILQSHGAYYDPGISGYVLWWKDRDIDKAGPLYEYIDAEEEGVPVEELLSGGEATQVAIELTGTAAVLQDIPASMIKEEIGDTTIGREDDNFVQGI